MKQITEIKKIGKGKRYYLFLDDELFGIFEDEILAKYCLKTGQTYDETFFEKLKKENDDYACFNRSLSILEKTIKSEKMLRDFLKGKKYSSDSIEKAIKKLKEYGYIDDEAYCENYIQAYSQSKSRKQLKYDLTIKGISDETIENLLEKNLDEEQEFENCLKISEKYMKNKEFDLKNKQKYYNHMISKGFQYDLINKVWDKLNRQN